MTLRTARDGRGLWFNCCALARIFALFSLFIISFPNISAAAEYPTRPIQVICPYPPGGLADLTARLVSQRLSILLGQSVVVVNRPGGGGVIGAHAVMGAAPDGYTILVTGGLTLMTPLLVKGTTFDLIKDFISINMTVSSPVFLIVKKDASWLTLEQFISDARKNPGKLTYASTGTAGTPYVAGELFRIYTGINITHIPMDGTGPTLTSVLGGHVNIGFPELAAVYNYLQAGSLRALAVLAQTRHKDFPDVPTTVEKGFPNIIFSAFQGFAVRAETPRAIVEKLENVFKEAGTDKGLVTTFEKTGTLVVNLGIEESKAFLVKDQQSRMEVIKAAKIVPK